MWWHPALCAPASVWARGNSEFVVSWTLIAEEPDAERI